jgi:hypothetical protein
MRIRGNAQQLIIAGCRQSFSLLEIMGVLWAFTFILFVGVTTLLGAFKIEQAATAAFTRQNQRNQLADQFRTDVASAIEAPDKLEPFTADGSNLILRLNEKIFVLYRYETSRLERAELNAPGDSPYWVTLGKGFEGAGFSHAAGGRLLTLRLTERGRSASQKHAFEFSAALGGDRR